MEKEKIEIVSKIICSMMNNQNIDVYFAAGSEEIGLYDKENDAYMLLSEVIKYVEERIRLK